MDCAQNGEFLFNLIDLVRERKNLYDKKHYCYFDREVRAMHWDYIALRTNRTALECKSQWKQLRTKFGRELRKFDNGSGSAWALFSTLIFLKDAVKPRRTRCNELVDIDSNSAPFDGFGGEDQDQDHAEEDNQSFLATSTPAKRRHMDQMEERSAVDLTADNSDELFLNAMVPLLKDLPVSVRDILKKDFFASISAARRQHL